MRSNILLGALALALAFAVSAAAQTSTTAIGAAPGVAGAAQVREVVASITKVDTSTREVTLKGAEGREVTIVAGPEVKNFAQMKPGDQVKVQYYEALTLELKKGGGKAVEAKEQTGKIAAKAGEKPAGAAGRQVTIVADVIAVDAATQMVTLRGPKRTVDLKVRDPEQFKLVKMGDQVEAVYTEALAVAVEPVKAAAK